MYLRGHHQNAYVTHNLEGAMELMSNRFEIEKWDRFDPDMTVNTLTGHQPLSVRVASAWIDGLNIEIIEPVSGYVEHYVSMLPSDKKNHAPHFHHMSFRRDDEAAMRKEVERLGLPLAFEGPVSIKVAIPSLVFMYFDARQTLGHYVEFTWKSPEAWEFVGWPKNRPPPHA